MELITTLIKDEIWSACIVLPGEWVVAGPSNGSTERRAIGQLKRDTANDIRELEILLEQKRAALSFLESST